jgi:hypothetical protein
MTPESGMAIDGAGGCTSATSRAPRGASGCVLFAAGASGNVPPEATLASAGEYGFAVAP